MNIFKEMLLSTYSYKSYPQFLNNKKSKVVCFSLLFMLLYFSITILAPCFNFLIKTGSFGTFLDNYVPNFSLTREVFWVETPVEYDMGDSYICVDTSPNFYFHSAEDISETLSKYSYIILMDSEKIILKDDTMMKEIYCSDLGIEFSREDVVAFIPFLYLIIVLFLILAFIFMTAGFFLGVLVIAFLAMFIGSRMKYALSFRQLYQLGVYSRTLPLILKAVCSLFSVDFPWLMNCGTSLCILIYVMQEIKENPPKKFKLN